MKRKNLILFFLLPYAGVLAIFLGFSLVNRATIQRKTEALVHEQLFAAARILDVNISHFLGEGMAPADVLALYSGEENIYYMALLDGRKNILAWRSRYEGYLPFSAGDARRNEPWIIESPVGRIFNQMSTFRGKDGTTYFLYLGYSLASVEEMIARSKRNALYIFALLSAAGVAFFVGLFILQKRYMAKVLEAESEREEKERFREMSAFTSSVAHEIKNPLNSLSLLFDLMLKKGPAEVGADAALGKKEVRKISQVVDTFSNHLKPIAPVRAEVPLKDLVAEARRSVPDESVAAGVAFRFSEASPVTLNVDRDLFTRCLANVLRNAFEATAAGVVAVTAKKARRKTLITVADTGRGMAPDHLGHVFDPFFSTKEKGMGIGLYLAKRIVEAHGGKIWASSATGQGTTFYLQIPGEDHE